MVNSFCYDFLIILQKWKEMKRYDINIRLLICLYRLLNNRLDSNANANLKAK